jgi:Tfp pilus assembly protein PilF
VLTLSGGVAARARLTRRSFDIYDSAQMTRLRAALATSNELAIELSDALFVPQPQLQDDGALDRHIDAGLRHLAEGRAGDALTALEEASRLDPACAEVDVYRAQAYALQGREKEARSAAAAAVSKDPGDPDLRTFKLEIDATFGVVPERSTADGQTASASLTDGGFGLLTAGDYPAAALKFEAALRLRSENADALLGRGLTRAISDDIDKALEDLKTAGALFHTRGDAASRAQKSLGALRLCAATSALRCSHATRTRPHS